LTTGPPLLPGLMAASIWRASKLNPAWEYSCISTRLTTPLVTDMDSPPTG